MIEGQDGLNWPRWQRLVRAAEDLGYAGLYRSDHFTNPTGPHKDALELWASLTWLAAHTARIEFGPLVSPVSFRNPVITAYTAAAVGDLSHGRLRLGLGAGWQEREHAAYGFELGDMDARFDRLKEAIQVIIRLFRSDEPVSYAGNYYRLADALLLPRPSRDAGPPIVIGGNGRTRTLPLAARFAEEWNATFRTPAQFAALNEELTRLIAAAGRDPSQVRRTLMTRLIFAHDDKDLDAKIAATGHSRGELRERGTIVGTANEIVAQLDELAGVGVQRVMSQWLDMDDIAGLEAMAKTVLPQLKGSGGGAGGKETGA